MPHHGRLWGDSDDGVAGRLRGRPGLLADVRRAAEAVRGQPSDLGFVRAEGLFRDGHVVHVSLAAADVAVPAPLLLAAVGGRAAVAEDLLGEEAVLASRVQGVHVDEGRVAGVLLRPLLQGRQAVQSPAHARVLNAVGRDQVGQGREGGPAEPVRQKQGSGAPPPAAAGGALSRAAQAQDLSEGLLGAVHLPGRKEVSVRAQSCGKIVTWTT